MKARTLLIVPFLVMMLAIPLGCAQNNETPANQYAQQQAPAATTQDQATQGTTIHFHVSQIPAGGPPATPDGNPVLSAVTGLDTGGNGTTLKSASSGLQQWITSHITTGGTTTGQTGTASAASTQTPTASPTATPTQDVRPRLSLPVNVAVPMPGAIADQGATANSGEGAAQSDKTSTNTVRWAQLIDQTAKQLGPEKAVELLRLLMAEESPPTPPAEPEPTPDKPEAVTEPDDGPHS